MTYSFDEQLKIGQSDEDVIFGHFSPDWLIRKAPRLDQRRGIDFFFRSRKTGREYSIELKSDRTASRTGNAFVESWSVYPKKKGWAWTCEANFLFYYLPEDRLIYVLVPDVIREKMPKWELYPERSIPNQGYVTKGHLVPLWEFEAFAESIISF